MPRILAARRSSSWRISKLAGSASFLAKLAEFLQPWLEINFTLVPDFFSRSALAATSLGCRKEIDSGELIRLLPDWHIGFTEVHAVIAAGRNAKPSARGFVDYLAASFREAT